jgi:hypothetical protein
MSDWAEKAVELDRIFRPGGAEQCCRRCQFWQRHSVISEDEDGDSRGECRRHAPSPIQSVASIIGRAVGAIAWACEEAANVNHSNNEIGGVDYEFASVDQYHVNEWPFTQDYDWCGDFIELSSELLEFRDTREKEIRELYEQEKAEREAAE